MGGIYVLIPHVEITGIATVVGETVAILHPFS
jgi:hypothetical protein